MSYLFVSRNNVHARYYKELCPQLSIATKIHIMGKPRFSALKFLIQACAFNFDEIIEAQLKRKQSRGRFFWHFPLVIFLYTQLITIIETFRLAKYLSLFAAERPCVVVLWNGKKLPNQTVVEAAKLSNIDVFYFENGLLPNTTSLDPRGVNYTASIPRSAEMLAKVRNCPADFSPPPIVQRVAHKNRKQGKEILLPQRFIFVPFQVPHDTQISRHSPWIESMEHMFDEVMAAVDKLNDESLYVVFKEHPSWHKHFSELYTKHPKALFANDNNTADIIKQAQAVITINSTVGFEGLLLGKPVITLGEACYNIEGLVLNAMDQRQLVNALQQITNWQPDPQTTENFFKYLETIYAIPGSWKTPDAKHIAAIEARLTQQDILTKVSRMLNA